MGASSAHNETLYRLPIAIIKPLRLLLMLLMLLLLQGELECRCKGSALVRVPQRLPVNMQRLSISTAGIPMLRYTGLKIYGSSLQDM